MSEIPFIDFDAATAEELRKYCEDNFGKKIHVSAKDETVRERFAQIYLEETGNKVVRKDPLFDDDEVESEPDTKKKPQPTHATIIIQDHEGDTSHVSGCVNSLTFLIQRNVEVKVRAEIVEVLRNAVRTVYDPITMAPKDVLAYPFSIIEYHFED
ncbi:MAG: hypothetical protein JZU65_16175 [Chlorobium sp.]|nr:hypothetical protein [Chlorobium sp.]